jgi:ribokinase
MIKKTITMIGSSCIDVYYELEKIPTIGEKVNGKFSGNKVGGMIGNAAAVMSGYGQEVYMIDFLEDSEESELLISDIKNYNISEKGIAVSNKYQNNKCLVFLEQSGERVIIILNSENEKFILNNNQIDILNKSDYIYSTVSDLKRLNDLSIIENIINKSNTKLVLDLEEAGLKDESCFDVIKLASVVFVNETAVEKLESLIGFNKIIETVETVVVTLGEKGSLTYNNGSKINHKVVMVDVVDTTGAGDTYNASYLFGLTQNWSIEKCGKFASYAASEKIKKIGPRSGVRPYEEIIKIMND